MTTRKTAKTTTRRSAPAKPATPKSAPGKPVATASPTAKRAPKARTATPKTSHRLAAAKRSAVNPVEKTVAETLVEKTNVAAKQAIERAQSVNEKQAVLASAVMETISSDTETLMEPVQAFNSLAIDNASKVAQIQIVAFRRYSELVLNGAREMAGLDEPEAIQAFVVRQGEAIRSLADAAGADFQAMTRIGFEYVQAAGAILNRSGARSI
jgi:phasin family protein